MPFRLYDYVNTAGENEFKKWSEGLEKSSRAKLNAKLDMLQAHGEVLFPQVLTGTDVPGIQKLRIKGNVQLRPMLCKGPIDCSKEFTLLLGAIEKGNKLDPQDAPNQANTRKQEVIQDPTSRRKNHERVG